MRKEEFRTWLSLTIKKKPASDCLSRCNTVEYALKVNLDDEYKRDGGKAVLEKLSYSRRDASAGIPAPAEFHFKQGANVVQRITDLRSAVNRYFTFCREEEHGII